jgi:hypothetical protein
VVNGRTETRVTAACEALRREHLAARLDGFVADLSRAEEALAAGERFPNPEILVNNFLAQPVILGPDPSQSLAKGSVFFFYPARRYLSIIPPQRLTEQY